MRICFFDLHLPYFIEEGDNLIIDETMSPLNGDLVLLCQDCFYYQGVVLEVVSVVMQLIFSRLKSR